MKNVIAFDGGGTKTRGVISDTSGKILADCLGPPSNNHTSGSDETKKVLNALFNKCLAEAGLSTSEISIAFLGLAGLDLPSDFKLLHNICKEIFNDVPFKAVNDAWIIMRSGLSTHWGAVSIYGTGANAAAIHPNGTKSILRALSYQLGGYGGGGDIANEALHHAFRSQEQTGQYSLLEAELPKLLSVNNMDDLATHLFPENRLSFENFRKIPPLVFKLAQKGDSVCKNILQKMGKIQGEMVSGVIKKLHMEALAVPVVLGGSVFNNSFPVFIDSMKKEINKTAPNAYFIVPELPPVAGALLASFDTLDITISDDIYNALKVNLK